MRFCWGTRPEGSEPDDNGQLICEDIAGPAADDRRPGDGFVSVRYATLSSRRAPETMPHRPVKALAVPPNGPMSGMSLRHHEAGLWVAESDGTGGDHLLGIVAGQVPPVPGPTLILPFTPMVRDGMGAYLTEAELGFDPLSRDEVVAALREMPSEPTLRGLAWILSRLSEGRTSIDTHLALAAAIFGDAQVMTKLRAWCQTPGHVIFSEQGLFALVAQAVIHCPDDGRREITAQEELALKRLLIASTGLLHDDPHSGDFGEYDVDNPEPFLAYMTQNLLFNAATDFGSALARTWRAFGELARDRSRTWKTPVDVDELLDDMGLSVEQQLALAFSLYAGLGIGTGVIAMQSSLWRSICERVAPDLDPDEVIRHIAATRRRCAPSSPASRRSGSTRSCAGRRCRLSRSRSCDCATTVCYSSRRVGSRVGPPTVCTTGCWPPRARATRSMARTDSRRSQGR